jgi:hypothetical protein
MERNAAYGDGFPAGGATGSSYGPIVRYGDPRRPFRNRNAYVQDAYNAGDAYDARYIPG